jgi:hypothetical protein
MADTELPPWEEAAQKGKSADLMPWEEAAQAKPSITEDVAKSVVPSLTRGGIGLLTTPRAISDMTGAGVNWLANKVAPQGVADAVTKFHNTDTGIGKAFPSSDELKGDVERDLTGPMYEAKTAPGRITQGALEVAPSLLAGGEGLLPAAAKAIGSGIGSEGLGDAASWLKGHFPNAMPDWAEPIARGIGAMAGTGLPALSRKGVTPLPMTDERLATVNALRQTNPELVNASSAGQLTESPRLAAMEGRSPRMADLPNRQNEAYTQGVMRQAGSTGMFDDAGLAQAKGTGAQLDTLRNANRMSPEEFALLNQDVGRMGRPGSDLYRAVGPSKPFADVRDAIRNGPSGGNPPPLDMTGQRYGALRQMMRSAEEGAPTSHEQVAIANARGRLNSAFQNSMAPEEAERLRQLDRQYSNYKTIENIPVQPGVNVVTPNQVSSKAPRGSDLSTHSDQAASVMRPLPKPTESGNAAPLVGSVAGLGIGAAASHFLGLPPEGTVAAILGGERAGNAVAGAKNIAGRVVSRPTIQNYLKNQYWRPGANTAPPDMADLVRLLAASPESQRLTGGSQ